MDISVSFSLPPHFYSNVHIEQVKFFCLFVFCLEYTLISP